MNKTMKIVGVLLAVMLVFAMSTAVFATEEEEGTKAALDWDGATGTLNNATPVSDDAQSSVAKMANAIIGVVQVVGMAVAVIMLIVLAIKYISAAPSDKAEIKKHAVVYIVGAVVLFAASGILEIIQKFALNIG